MKNQTQLINNIIGQLEGIKKMIENKEDCFKTITQMKAANSAMKSVMLKYIEQYFVSCLNKSGPKSKKEDLKKAFEEVIKQ